MADNNGSNNALYFIVGALVVAILVGGYVMMSGKVDVDEPGVSIDISKDGVSIDD